MVRPESSSARGLRAAGGGFCGRDGRRAERRRVGREADHAGGDADRFGDVERLRRAGLDDLAIADVIQAAAFFNWATRLMLSLGEPTPAP